MSDQEPIDLGGGITWTPPERDAEDSKTLARLDLAAMAGASVTVRLRGVEGGHTDIVGTVEKTADGFRITPHDS